MKAARPTSARYSGPAGGARSGCRKRTGSMPPAPRRRAACTFSTIWRRRQPVRPDARPDGMRARCRADRSNLRRELRRVGRIRHRADDVDEILIDPRLPVLEMTRGGVGGIRLHGRAQHGGGPHCLHGFADPFDQRGEAAGPKCAPALGKGQRVDERFSPQAPIVRRSYFADRQREIADDVLPEYEQRLPAVVEVVVRVAHVVEMNAVNAVALRDVPDDADRVVGRARRDIGERYSPSMSAGRPRA